MPKKVESKKVTADGNPYAGRPRMEAMARIFDALVKGPANLDELAKAEGLSPNSTRLRLCGHGHGRGPKYIKQRWDMEGRSDEVKIVLKRR